MVSKLHYRSGELIMPFDILNMSLEELESVAVGMESTPVTNSQKALTAAKLATAGLGRPIKGIPTQSELALKFGISRSMVSDAKKFLNLVINDEVKYGYLYQKIMDAELTITEACKVVGLKTTPVSARTASRLKQLTRQEIMVIAGIDKDNDNYDNVKCELLRVKKILKECDYDIIKLVITQPIYDKNFYDYTPHKFFRELIHVTAVGGNICIVCKNEMVRNYLMYEHTALIFRKIFFIDNGDMCLIWFNKKEKSSQYFTDNYRLNSNDYIDIIISSLSESGDIILDPFRSIKIKNYAERIGRHVYGAQYF